MFIDVNKYKEMNSDSEMIQAALDEARVNGKAVIISKYNERTGQSVWNIDKTVLLYSESTLILQNAHLRLADGAICNMFTNSNARTELAKTDEGTERNIHVLGIGKAVLDGGIHNGMYEDNGIARKVVKNYGHHIIENCTMYFQNVENIVIENLTFKNSRYWSMYFIYSAYGRVSNIHFESDSNVPNQDGVDMGKGTHNFIVEKITGCVGDNIIAINVTGHDIYGPKTEDIRKGDVHNIIIRDLLVYCVGGVSLIRLLNHDGYRIYNIRIENVIEISDPTENDAALAQNPDLTFITDSEGNILPRRTIIPGEIGYRSESAIIIGESYWYEKTPAQKGDTFGISVSNIMTRSRFAVALNNTLTDSTFENIRLFGNGYMAAYFGKGEFENVSFNNVRYDRDATPHKDDENIFVEWNGTETHGYNCVYFNGANVENVEFNGLYPNGNIPVVFGGYGEGEIKCSSVNSNGLTLSELQGIKLSDR